MHDTTLAHTALALFTTADKAAEIEGDLLEQSQRHGRLWFWLQIKLTCAALFLHGLRAEGGKLLIFSYATYELVIKSNWWLLNPLRRSLRRSLELDIQEMAIANSAIFVVYAFWLGLFITRMAPRSGGSIILLASGLVLGRLLLLDGLAEAAAMLPYAVIGLAGALIMKWQELRRDGGWKCREA